MAHLSLRLLGPFQATLDGQPVTAFESDKVRALLAYLAVEAERSHRRERLAGLLWPEMPEGTARANLRHALAVLRSALGDATASPATLLVTRQTIQFNRQSDAWVDVHAYLELVAGDQVHGQALPQLEEASGLVRGLFLEGFSLRDSLAFDEWLVVQREHLARLHLALLHRLAAYHWAEGAYETALRYAWQQVVLEPYDEEARQQLMSLLALSGQRAAALAQYEALREMLRKELGVEPAPETAALCEQIRDGTPLAELARRPEPPPAFLTGRAAPARAPVFVAREPELVRLEGYLSAALSGRGQMAFVVGGPGRGKTALLGEFARRAMDTHPELLLAMGAGGAYAGVGDPYLPFREALAMLSGEVEGRWTAGTVTTEQARRIWAALPEVGAVLAERGSDLVGTLLSGRELLGRARVAAPGGAGWLARLARLAERDAPAQSLEQSHLFEQVANVLLDLSARHPLLVVLDDLQWADLASISLLFHLGRRLDRGRILLAGAYRPHELAIGRDGERHPLEPVLAELQQRYGDAWLDLAAADEAGGRRFVDQFLDTEPNRLAQGFRGALFQRTGGHPLFTKELLRAMQGRGDLVRDEAGRWTEGATLEWGALPAQVEAAIAERIDRLPEALRRVLAVASVEGEEFTAQAVGRVQGMDELQVLRLLRGELAGRQRLVREQGEARVDGGTLSRYRFAHFLFQQHLYRGLGEGERRLLHRRVGEALEQLYEGHLEDTAVQLARHFAGDPERERRYARLAGERAAAQFANEEAVRYLSHALELTPESEPGDRCALLLTRETVYDLLGQRDPQRHDLAELGVLAGELGAEQKAEVAVRRARYASRTGDYPAAIAAAQEAVDWAQAAGHASLHAWGHVHWGTALFRQGDLSASQVHYEEALVLARSQGLRALEAVVVVRLAQLSADLAQKEAYGEQALRIAREAGDRQAERVALNNLAVTWRALGDLTKSWTGHEQSLRLAREMGDLQGEALALGNLGVCCYDLGDYARGWGYLEDALPKAEEIKDRYVAAQLLSILGDVACALGEYAQARGFGEQALRFARDIGDLEVGGYALYTLGALHRSLGNHATAWDHCAQALRLFRQMSMLGDAMASLSGLACADLALGQVAQAQAHVAEILAYLDAGGCLDGDCRPFWTYLTCYQVLVAAGDPRAHEILTHAHTQLQEWAARIPDETLRRSFLENVAENRELVRTWEAAQAGVSPEGEGA